MRRGWLIVVGLSLVAVGSAVIGCEEERFPRPPPPDGGLTPSEPPRRLELESAPSLALGYQESHTFEVRYLQADGTALADHTVTFALDGQAHDSTLGTFEATTLADGRATGTLTAGSTAAAFRVRISAPHASSVYIDVSVSDVGFGDLAVTVIDGTEGRDVDRFVVRLHPEASCEDPDLDDALPAREVVAQDLTALLSSLPADLGYAVVARAEGSEGGLLGRGCVEAEVEADGQVNVEVPVSNVPLTVEGAYDGRLHVEAGASAGMAADAVEAAGTALLTAVGGDAELLLDAIQAYLDANDPDFAWMFENQRELMEPALADALGDDGVGGHVAIAAAANVLQPALASFDVTGTLWLDPSDADEPVRWNVDHADVEDPDTEEVHTLALAGMAAEIALALHLDRDAVDLLTLEVPLALGDLAQAALQALMTDGSGDALVDRLHGPIGCDTLVAWVANDPVALGLCDEECALTACADASLVLLSAMVEAASDLSTVRGRLVFETPVIDGTLSDTAGDGAVDAMALPPLSGTWTTAAGGGGDDITGDLHATRAGDLP